MTNTNTLKLTALTKGEYVQGEVLKAEAKTITTKTGQSFEGVYITLRTDEGDVELQTAGNVKKFFKQDSAKGMYAVGTTIKITRGDDVTLKNGFSTSHFFVEPVRTTAATTASAVPAVSKKAELQAKLAQARGK